MTTTMKGKDRQDMREAINRMVNFNRGKLMTEMPLEINLEDLFDDVIVIKTVNYSAKGGVIGVDIPVNDKIFSVIGRVSDIKKIGKFYEITIDVEYVPEDMYHEIEEIINKAYY